MSVVSLWVLLEKNQSLGVVCGPKTRLRNVTCLRLRGIYDVVVEKVARGMHKYDLFPFSGSPSVALKTNCFVRDFQSRLASNGE